MTIDLLSLGGIAVVLAAPGPTNALIATAAATRAPLGPLRTIGAVLAGYLVAVGLLRLVGAPVFAVFPVLVPAMKLVLAAWLAVIGLGLWRYDPTTDGRGPIDGRRLFGTTLLNPKAAIFAFGFFPDTADRLATALWVGFLAAAIVVEVGAWWAVGRLARAPAAGSARWVPRIASLVLIGFGLVLAGTTLAAVR